MKHTCTSCGTCCRLFLIPLTQKEWESGTYETQFCEFSVSDSYIVARRYGATLLKQHEDGSCIYLINTLCSIHARRPNACRAFFCSSKSKQFQSMIALIRERKKRAIRLK